MTDSASHPPIPIPIPINTNILSSHRHPENGQLPRAVEAVPLGGNSPQSGYGESRPGAPLHSLPTDFQGRFGSWPNKQLCTKSSASAAGWLAVPEKHSISLHYLGRCHYTGDAPCYDGLRAYDQEDHASSQ